MGLICNGLASYLLVVAPIHHPLRECGAHDWHTRLSISTHGLPYRVRNARLNEPSNIIAQIESKTHFCVLFLFLPSVPMVLVGNKTDLHMERYKYIYNLDFRLEIVLNSKA